jgi:hypothetical protein
MFLTTLSSLLQSFSRLGQILCPSSLIEQPDNLQLFLDQARDKSISAVSQDLVESYGEIFYEDVATMPLPTWMKSNSREAQDSFMFYQCLMNSLTADAAQKQASQKQT